MTCRKGILFTLDALLALLISGLFIFLTYQLLIPRSTASSSLELSRLASDVAVTLDETGTLAAAVNSSSTAGIYNFLQVVPLSYCVRVRIPGVSPVTNQNCQCSGDIAVATRSVVLVSSSLTTRVASVEACYK